MTENESYQNDEIDLRELLLSITSRKKFIIGFTSIVTALAAIYVWSITPTYQASISFLSPSQSSIIALNKSLYKLNDGTAQQNIQTNENMENNIKPYLSKYFNSDDVYRKFLNKVMSKEFQRKVFDENDYLAKLNPMNKSINNLDDLFRGFSNSITLKKGKIQNGGLINFEVPVVATIEGRNAQVIANFLNDLASSADKETINYFLSIINQKIAMRLEEISKKIQLLQQHHNKKRSNDINELLYHLSIAKELKIKNNSLGSGSNMANSSLIIGSGQELPKWYLLGGKALAKEIDLLKSNEYVYIPEISDLEIEKIRLKSIVITNSGINSMQLNQRSFIPRSPIKPNKNLIMSTTAGVSFILSILWVLIMSPLRAKNNKVTE